LSPLELEVEELELVLLAPELVPDEPDVEPPDDEPDVEPPDVDPELVPSSVVLPPHAAAASDAANVNAARRSSLPFAAGTARAARSVARPTSQNGHASSEART
jgi:hypothetical protein